MLEWINTLAPYMIAIASVIAGIYSVVCSGGNQLDAAYFEKMTAAYEQHWKAFSEFVYHPSDKTRDAYTVAVYNAVLYASEDVAVGIRLLYNKALDMSCGGYFDTETLDRLAGYLEELLCKDVSRFRARKKRVTTRR